MTRSGRARRASRSAGRARRCRPGRATTRSASFPGVIEPRSVSWPPAYAAPVVYASSQSPNGTDCSGSNSSPDAVRRSTPRSTPHIGALGAHGSSLDPARRTPASARPAKASQWWWSKRTPLCSPTCSTNPGCTTATAPRSASARHCAALVTPACSTRNRWSASVWRRAICAAVSIIACTPALPMAWTAMRNPWSAARSACSSRSPKSIPKRNALPVDARVERDRHAAIGEQLHRADAKPVVALAGGRTVESGSVLVQEQRRGMRHAHHVDRQRASARHRRVEGLGLGGACGVVHACDALGEQCTRPIRNVFGPAVGIGEVVHRPRVRLAPRLLDQDPRRLTGAVASDLAARRVGSVATDAEGIESGRAHHTLVQRVVGHDHGPVECCCVEVVAGDACAGTHQVDALAAHPHGVGPGRGLRMDGLDEHVALADAAHLVPVRVQRRDREVVVRVDQSGDEHRAREVDELGAGGIGTFQQLDAADRDDPFALDEHDVRVGRGAGHGEDGSAGERAHACHGVMRRRHHVLAPPGGFEPPHTV